jgi:hypothetical protein
MWAQEEGNNGNKGKIEEYKFTKLGISILYFSYYYVIKKENEMDGSFGVQQKTDPTLF